MKAAIFKFVLLIIFISTANQFAQEKMSFRQKVEWNCREFEKAQLAGDTQKILTMYTDDAVSLPSYEPMLSGKADIEKAMIRDKKAGIKITDFNLTTMETFESGDYVYEIGKYKVHQIMPAPMDPIDDMGKYLVIHQIQKDGSLKVKAEIWNTDMNPWVMNNTKK